MSWLPVFLLAVWRSFRSLLRTPRFAVPVVCMIAIGIGCTAAVFSIVDRVLFRDPPYPNSGRIVSLGVLAPIVDGEFLFSRNALEWKRDQKPFETLTAWGGVFDCDLSDAHPQRIACADVDASFLPTFGVSPRYGRNFNEEEDRPKAERVALISHALWRSRFGSDPGIVGHVFSLDGEDTRIVGVLPTDFEFPTMAHADVLVPLAVDPISSNSGPGRVVRLFGRMRQGTTLEQAQSQMRPLFDDFVQSAPPPFRKILKLRLKPLKEYQVGDSRLASQVLFASVLALLLLVCANLANLMLARSVERQREFAVRAALGASPWRLLSERLGESVAVSALGCVAGLVLAIALLKLASATAPAGLLRLQQAHIDWRVLLFAIGAACFSSVLGVLGSLLEKPRAELLTGGAMQTSGRSLVRSALLSVQVAVALVLLTNAILLVRSLYHLQRAPLGMNTEHVVSAELSLGAHRYGTSEQKLAFYEELEHRMTQMPGVTSFGFSDSLPPSTPTRSMPLIAVEAEGLAGWNREQGTGPEVGWRAVTPGYFSTLGITLLRGHAFHDDERGEHDNTIVLNSTLATLLFGQNDPVGRNVRFTSSSPGEQNPWMIVVGVVADAANSGLGTLPTPEFYLPRRHTTTDLYFRGASARNLSIMVRSPIAAEEISNQLRGIVSSLDPTLPVETATMQERVARLAERPRFSATMLSLFAAIGIVLTTIGVYSVIALLVAQRSREIGIRMALGATPARIMQMVLGHGLSWVALGAILGLVGSQLTGRYVQHLLFGIGSQDPSAIAASLTLILLVGLCAIVIPSRRAAMVDPMVVLRRE